MVSNRLDLSINKIYRIWYGAPALKALAVIPFAHPHCFCYNGFISQFLWVRISEAQLCSSGFQSLVKLQSDGCGLVISQVSFIACHASDLKQLGSLGIFLHLCIFCPQVSSAWQLQGSRFLIMHGGLPRSVFWERERHTEPASALMTLTYPTFIDRAI